MGHSKNLVAVLLHFFLTQNALAQTIVGLAANPGQPPYELVSIDPITCLTQAISKFESGGLPNYYLYYNAGWVDQNGYYYANFLSTTNWWGAGITYIFDLNNPSSGWKHFGDTTMTSFASNTQGVYAIGTNGENQCIGVSISATSQSENSIGNFPSDYAPSGYGATTIDGSGNLWSFFSDADDDDFWVAMDISSGGIVSKNEIVEGFPFPKDIHWDSSKNEFFFV